MKRVILTAALSVCSLLTMSQNPGWTIPGKYMKAGTTPTFSNLPQNLVSDSYHGQLYDADPVGGLSYFAPSNSYPDNSGNPLFFVVNGKVYNKNGYKISQLNHNQQYNIAEGWAENCIVQNPANCKQFYVFTAGYTGGEYISPGGASVQYFNYNPYYALIDMDAMNVNSGVPQGEKGKNITNNTVAGGNVADLIVTTATPTNNGYPAGRSDVHFASTKLLSGNYKLLFVTTNSEILVYKITGTPVNPIQFVSLVDLSTASGGVIGRNHTNVVRSELELFEDVAAGKIKLAFSGLTVGAGFDPPVAKLCLAEYSLSGSFISNSIKSVSCVNAGSINNYPGNQIAGIEFSPSGKYVYFTHTYNQDYPNTIEAVDFANPANRYSFASIGQNMLDFQHSQIEKGRDNKLYFITGNRIARINNPNVAYSPASITWSNNVGSLNNYPLAEVLASSGSTPNYLLSYFLPDQVDQDFYTSIPEPVITGINKICSGTNTILCVNYADGYNIVWTIPGKSGPIQIGTGECITVAPTTNTTYTVTVTNSNGCSGSASMTVVVVENNPAFSLTSTPNGSKFNLKAVAIDLTANQQSGFSSNYKVVEYDPVTNSEVSGTSLSQLPEWNQNQAFPTNYFPYYDGTSAANYSLPASLVPSNKYYKVTRYTSNNYCPTTKFFEQVIWCPSSSRIVMDETSHFENLGMENANEERQPFEIYPNPSNGIFHINLKEDFKGVLEVYDLLGNKIQEQVLSPLSDNILNLSSSSKGIYLLKINSKGKFFSKRIIIE